MSVMKKIVNDPDMIAHESSEGFAAAYPGLVEYLPGYKAIMRKGIPEDKVLVLGTGGRGAEPLYPGFLVYGMLDGTCHGDVFAAPSAYNLYCLIRDYHKGKGAVLIYGNFAGDFMNGDMAAEMLELEGIEVVNMLIRDEIPAGPDDMSQRGGVAGILYAAKMVGAASELGYTIDGMRKLKVKMESNFFTMPVTLFFGAMPSGAVMGEVAEGMVEFGMGFNGESGMRSEKMMPADQMADIALDYVIDAMRLARGEEVAVIINSQGAATLMELWLVMRRVKQRLDGMGVSIYGSDTGEYFTSQETKGFSITLVRMDGELKKLYDYPAYTPYFVKVKQSLFAKMAKDSIQPQP